MSKIALIAAVAEKGAIGRDQQLLCHLPNDLKHFKTLTSGHTVVMGRKTFESLPNGALPNRKNIVLTHNTSLSWPNVTVVHTLDEIPIQDTTEDEIFIMGGATLYNETIKIADTLYITHIHHTFDDAVTSSAAAVYGSASSRTNPFPPNRLKSVWVMVKAIPNSGLLWFSRAASFMNLTVLMKHLLVKLSALLRPSFRSSPCSLHVKSASNRSAE